MRNLLAGTLDLTPSGGFKGLGPLGLEGSDASDSLKIFNKVISSAVGLMTIIAGLWFIFILLGGAIGIISAGGDKAKLEEAKAKMTSGLIGIVVTVAAVFLVDLIGKLIGLDILGGALRVENITQ